MPKEKMMYKEISEKYIIQTLQCYEEKTIALRREMSKQYSQLFCRDNDVMKSVAYSQMHYNATATDISDILDVIEIYEKYQKLEKKKIFDIKFTMRDIVEEQESMNRIMAAFSVLDDQQRELLTYLYIDNPKKIVTAAISEYAEKYELCDMTIYRLRKKSLKKIKEIYDSDLTQAEIYRCKKRACLNNINPYR